MTYYHITMLNPSYQEVILKGVVLYFILYYIVVYTLLFETTMSTRQTVDDIISHNTFHNHHLGMLL